MMVNKRERTFAALLLTAALGSLLALSTPAFAGSAAEEATPLYQAFQSRYEEIQQAVKRGALPDETNSRAQDLWVSLRKDLISRNARIDILRLEATQYTGERQQRALDEIIRETADREGMIANYLGKLDRMAAKGGSEASVIAVPEVSPRVTSEPMPEKSAPVKAKPRNETVSAEPKYEEEDFDKKRYKLKNIEIDLSPEDLIREPQFMD
jgi:hypothetical protein